MKTSRHLTRKQLTFGALILGFLVLCNYSFLFRLYVLSPLTPDNTISFTYITPHAEFRARELAEWKTGKITYDQVQQHFSQFKKCFPTSADTILYRTFTKDAWQFWNWAGYLTHPRYKLPYINSATVPPLRKQSRPNLCPGIF